MSIIYEALKKVEANQTKTLELQIDKGRKPKYKIYLLYATVLCSGFLLANIFFNLFISLSYKNLSNSKRDSIYLTKSPQPQALPTISDTLVKEDELNSFQSLNIEKQPLSSLVLNGVFFSENQVYALINNRIIREGDVIEGATVKRITLEGVELELEGKSFFLKPL